jgi:hypothetical protein
MKQILFFHGVQLHIEKYHLALRMPEPLLNGPCCLISTTSKTYLRCILMIWHHVLVRVSIIPPIYDLSLRGVATIGFP